MNYKKGFTLIELLVVISVIGLLTLVTVVALGQKREQMRDIERLSNMRDLQAHLELYFVTHNQYPVVAPPGKILGSADAACLSNSGFVGGDCPDPIMKNIPQDPGDFQYVYTSTDGLSYSISAQLEGQIESLQGKIVAVPSVIRQVE